MTLDFSEFDAGTLDDVVRYLNFRAGLGVQDDPDFTTGNHLEPDYSIGATVARRIKDMVLKHGFMWDVHELEDVNGFGQDKLRDVVYTVRHRIHAALLRELAPSVTEGNQADMVLDGPDCLRVILDEISKAQHYIHVQMMLFFSDKAGLRVATALAERARAGVTVRVMADAATTKSGYYASAVNSSGQADFARIARDLIIAGAKVIDTDQESYWESEWSEKREVFATAGVPEVFLLMQDFVQDDVQANWNVVDHRKFIVIDGVTSLIGSLNLGGNYLYQNALDARGLPAKPGQWHDGMLRIRGPFADGLNRMFASTWMVRGGEVFDFIEHHRAQSAYGDDRCALVGSFPGTPQNLIRRYHLAVPELADGRVVILNPYICDAAFFRRLGSLPKSRAKKVTLINPYTAVDNDYPFSASSIRCNMWVPFERGVRFYDYSGGKRMAHLKIMLDVGAKTVCHGSYNLNYRSAYHDFEAVAIVQSARLAEQVRVTLERDIAVSRRVTDVEEFYEYPNVHASCHTLWAADWFA